MIDDAIARYHGLLQSDPALAAASQEALDAGLHEENLFFGDRPLCSVLRPHMITTGQYARVREACRLVIGATIKVGARLLADERLLEPLRLSPREQELARIDHGYDAVSAISRLDAFLAGDSLSFIEYNAETPAGGAYTDVLTSVFLRLPVVRRFLDAGGYTLQTFDTRAGLTDLLLRCYQSWAAGAGRAENRPSIGIVDWAGLPTAYEHELYRRHFEGRGLPAVIVDPRELEYAGGALRHGDTVIDLVYKRVLVHELLAREAEAPALLQAYEDGAVCMVNSPRDKLFHKKAIFALLTDAAYQGGFTPEEREAVRRHVPWTRRVADARATFEGKEVDLMELLRTQRERFVLKPNDDYGGKGVVVGWEGSAGDWDRALEEALRGDYVAQERVAVARAQFPAVVDGRLEFRELSVDMDPFIVDGAADGFLTRVAGTTLLNVTAGGGSTVPTFVLHE
jgi:glutathionylspermidine synthase